MSPKDGKLTVDVINARLNDHLAECSARYLETRKSIDGLRSIITKGGWGLIGGMAYIIYQILHAKGEI